MKKLKNMRFISLLLTLVMIVMMGVPTVSLAATTGVNLGTASNFAVLAGSAVTNTGTTTITGDVGLHPETAFTGQEGATVNGTLFMTDAVASLAKNDLVIAYNDAAGRQNATVISSELGGATLTPGTYVSAGGTFQITGTLTLDAQNDPNAVFIFQTASTLTTDSASDIKLIASAQAGNVFWQVGSSATLGTNSHFEGNILAMVSITATTGASVTGRLLARNGAVTLDGNTITIDIPEVTPPVVTPPVVTPPEVTPELATLNVIKHVINDDGGTAVAADFVLYVKEAGVDVGNSPASGAESPGRTYTLAAGTYVISEDSVIGYTASYSGDSNVEGSITLAPGDNKTVTIINNDNEPVAAVEPSDIPETTEPVTETVTGGELPETSTGVRGVLLAGAALTLFGALGLISRKRNI